MPAEASASETHPATSSSVEAGAAAPVEGAAPATAAAAPATDGGSAEKMDVDGPSDPPQPN